MGMVKEEEVCMGCEVLSQKGKDQNYREFQYQSNGHDAEMYKRQFLIRSVDLLLDL